MGKPLVGANIPMLNVVPLGAEAIGMIGKVSLPGQPDRNRQSDHAKKPVPAESTSGDGSEPARRPPAVPWWLMLDTSTVERQLAPPSMERNERIEPLDW